MSQNKSKLGIFVFFMLIVILSLSVLSSAFAVRYVDNQFVEATYDRNGDLQLSHTPVDNVDVIGFVCANAECSQVSGQIFDGRTLNSGASSTLQTYFPTYLQSNYGYAVFQYKEGYLAAENNPNYYGNGQVNGIFTRPLTKIESCSAPIDSFTVINDVYVNEPIMVDISASMDSTVHNLLSANGPIEYMPPVVAQQTALDVEVTL